MRVGMYNNFCELLCIFRAPTLYAYAQEKSGSIFCAVSVAKVKPPETAQRKNTFGNETRFFYIFPVVIPHATHSD